MVARFISWLRHAVSDLSEKAVDDALDDEAAKAIDFEILCNPQHSKFPEMRRRYHEQQAREDRDGMEQ